MFLFIINVLKLIRELNMSVSTRDCLLKIVSFVESNPKDLLVQQEQPAKIEEAIELLKVASRRVFSLKDSRLLTKQITNLTNIKPNTLTNEEFHERLFEIEKAAAGILINFDKVMVQEVMHDHNDLRMLLANCQLPFPREVWDELIAYAQEQRKLCSIPILQYYSDFYNQ
jgi:hypothetical protein